MTNPLHTSASLRVLVIDDDADCANSFAKLLVLHGHDVRVCFNGVDAIVTADTFAPHVIFLDLVMPQMSGLAVCKTIRQMQRDPRPRIVALTGSSSAMEGAAAAGAQFDSYLLKPASPGEWLALVHNAKETQEPWTTRRDEPNHEAA